MNPINRILENENCPFCGKKMEKTADSWAVRGYYLTCENKQCPFNKKEGGPYLSI